MTSDFFGLAGLVLVPIWIVLAGRVVILAKPNTIDRMMRGLWWLLGTVTVSFGLLWAAIILEVLGH